MSHTKTVSDVIEETEYTACGGTASILVKDEILFDGMYVYFYEGAFDAANKDAIRLVHWFPGVVRPVVSKDNRYAYPVNLIYRALEMLGIKHDSDKKVC